MDAEAIGPSAGAGTVEALYVVLVAIPVLLSLVLLATDRRAGVAAGRALARWAAGAPWHRAGLFALAGLAALAVALVAVRQRVPAYFVFLVLLPAMMFWWGLTGEDAEAGGEPEGRDRRPGWRGRRAPARRPGAPRT
jgi:hypothetical protein